VTDKYSSFTELSRNERKDHDYSIYLKRRDSGITAIVPHGGKLEFLTSEFAKALGNETHSVYCFEDLKINNNKRDPHVTSENFDDLRRVAV
jgi:phage replication-related protein YjqB (UPF0714/DUF867 family)